MNEIAKYNDMIIEIKEILQSARLNVASQVHRYPSCGTRCRQYEERAGKAVI